MGKGKGKQKNTKTVPTKPRKHWSKHDRMKQKILNQNRFWIQKCKNNKVPKTYPSSMILEARVTLVDLVDDHMHAGTKIDIVHQALPTTTTSSSSATEHIHQNTNSKSEDVQSSVESTIVQSKQNEEEKNMEQEEVEFETTQEIKEDTNDGNHNETLVKDPQPAMTEPFIKIRKSLELIEAMKHPIRLPQIQNLPNGDCGDGIINPHPKEEVPDKFWAQRKRLFYKYDEGILLDKESWYSVTPEVIANHIATRIGNMKQKLNVKKPLVVLDPFCGVGGNAIALARNDNISLVVCCDVDDTKLKHAAHNASIYGIPSEKLIFVHGNALTVLKSYTNGTLKDVDSLDQNAITSIEYKGYPLGDLSLLPNEIHVVFLSPPWGGMDYLQVGSFGFDLSKCIQVHGHDSNIVVDGEELLNMAATAASCKSVVYFLPKNIHGVSIAKCAFKVGYRTDVELEQNRLNGKLKTVTVYLSDIVHAY